MFSMFPAGWPGAGLLLLRVATGAVLIAQSFAYFGDEHELGLSGVALAALVSAAGFALLIGFMTRYVALLAAIVGAGAALRWLPKSSIGSLLNPAAAALATVVAVAVICLGPGALSVDARLFGQREIVIPP